MDNPTWSKVVLPALVGAAGTGTVSGLMSAGTNDPEETPQDRRRRIIKNTLLGAGAGGLAGAAIPTGLEALNRSLVPDSEQPGRGIIGGAVHQALKHPVLATAAAGGALAAHGHVKMLPELEKARFKTLTETLTKGEGALGHPLDVPHDLPSLRSLFAHPNSGGFTAETYKQRLQDAYDAVAQQGNNRVHGPHGQMQAHQLVKSLGGDLQDLPGRWCTSICAPRRVGWTGS